MAIRVKEELGELEDNDPIKMIAIAILTGIGLDIGFLLVKKLGGGK